MKVTNQEKISMFTHMIFLKKISHIARDASYEIFVYQVEETGECRIYVAKGGFGVGDIFTASHDVIQDAKLMSGDDMVEQLIATAIDDINRNEFQLY